MRYNKTFKEKAVKLVLAKEVNQSILEIATKLNISKATLYKWVKQAQDPQKSDTSFSTKEKLQILHETYAMSKEEVNAYCREKGLFKHQLQEFEEEFLNQKSSKVSEEETSKKALEEEKNKTKALAKELRRKEKALAETAALLVLQKKFQALFEDEEV
jgi:transposase-like protein